MAWTPADLPLIDEAACLIERPRRLGHVMIDEAQDLTPMHLRAIARRSAASCTVLGDLAQATNPAAAADWPTVLYHLQQPHGQLEELTHGYRVPAEIIDFAARLLPKIAPTLTAPASFRDSPGSLSIQPIAPEQLTEAIAAACTTALQHEGSVGVIVADADLPSIRHTLTASGLSHTILDDEHTGDNARLTIVPATLAKGLEYDTVIIIDPDRINSAEPRGSQRLYVALTRAVSNLTIIHSTPLPESLTQNSLALLPK